MHNAVARVFGHFMFRYSQLGGVSGRSLWRPPPVAGGHPDGRRAVQATRSHLSYLHTDHPHSYRHLQKQWLVIHRYNYHVLFKELILWLMSLSLHMNAVGPVKVYEVRRTPRLL